MSARKASHGTIFLSVSSGSPLALIASSRRSTSKKPFCPMTRSLHPPATAGGQRVRFATTWRDEFFEVPKSDFRGDRGRSVMAKKDIIIGRVINVTGMVGVLAGTVLFTFAIVLILFRRGFGLDIPNSIHWFW